MMRGPAIMIGLDAADSGIIDRLAGAGELPNLSRLKASGLWGRLASPAPLFAGGVWPTFYTGRRIPSHGVYHSKLWRPDRMRVEVAADDWLQARPFWEAVPGIRACIIDVPMVLGRPRSLNGVYLGGWGTHDLISRGSSPPDLWSDLERRFGPAAMPPEHFGRQSEQSLAGLPDALVTSTRQVAEIAGDVLRRDTFDLTCIVFGAAHRAGHYLWDRSQVDGDFEGVIRGSLQPGLTRVYREIDRAVGALLDEIPEGTLVVAFAVHGMGPNPGWSDLLPDILANLDRHRSGESPRRGALFRLKQLIPFHLARPVLNRLPMGVNQRLVSLWSRNMYDWSVTRCFPLPMDAAGYLRINLRGRERDGIVAPGAEYDQLCDELADLLLSLRDPDSNLPIAGSIMRAYADAAEDAQGRSLLPDLVISWAGPSATEAARLVSSTIRAFEYKVPRRLPSGRSGNHTGNAWFVARGPGVAVGETDRNHDVVDLAPTVLDHIGVPRPPGLDGTAIDLTRAVRTGSA